MRALLLAMALLLGLAVSALAAEDAAVGRIEAALDGGDPEKALALLDEKTRARLAKAPKDARNACGHVADNVGWITRKVFDPADVEELLEAIEDLAKRTVEANPKSGDAHRALALAHLSRGRFRDAAGFEPGPGAWEAAARHSLAAAERAEEVEHVVAASRYLLEAAGLPGAPARDLRDRAALVCERGIEKYGDVPDLRVGIGRVALAEAEALLGEGKKPAATQAARRAMTIVEPVTKSKKGPRSFAETTYNRAVAFLRTHKLGKKPEFLKHTLLSRWRYLELDLPAGRHWRVKRSKVPKGQLLDTLTRFDPGGGRTRIRLSRYRYGSTYPVGRVRVGGDNPKGLLEMEREEDLNLLATVSRQKKLIRTRLNKQISRTTGYEMWGTGPKGGSWWIRCWFFKAKERDATICVWLSRYGADPATDPEIDLILDSIREGPAEEE